MQPSFDENLVVFFDNEFRPLRDANVNFLTHALHYGSTKGSPRLRSNR